MQAGIEAVGKVASLQKDPPNTQVSQGSPALPDLSAVRAIMQQAQSETAIQSVQPDQPAKPRIRINRPGITENAGPQFQKVLTRSSQNKQPVPDETLSIDPQEVATKIDQLLRNIGMGGK